MTTLSVSGTGPTSLRTIAGLRGLRRALGLMLAVLFFLAGWVLIADQSALLWKRLPPDAADRYAADRIRAALPPLPLEAEIQVACAQPLTWRAGLRRAWLREELAQCLSSSGALVQGAEADKAIAHFEALIQAQVDASQAWLAASDQGLAAEQAGLARSLRDAQAAPPTVVALASERVAAWRPGLPVSIREPVGPAMAPDHAARGLKVRLAATRAQVSEWRARPVPERLRALALAATGLQLATDYGTTPPGVHLVTERRSLADTIEWQRRARVHQERGFDLAALQSLPVALFAGSAVLVVAAALAGRGAGLPVAAWALATHLLGLGALVLTDLALTGDPALRYLAQRQFLSLGVGDTAVPLIWMVPLPVAQSGALPVWWPAVAAALAVLLLGMVRTGSRWLLAPVRAWVQDGDSGMGAAWRAMVLVLLGVGIVLLLGMPAAVSELLILLGCAGVASCVARQAPLANAGAGLQLSNLLVVGVALTLAVTASLLRGDLGHALVAISLAACFAWLFGWRWLRWAVAGAGLLFVALMGHYLISGVLTGPLGWLVARLPPHAQDRFSAMVDPLHAASSDLARTHWLMDSAGAGGWGHGYVPWQGLAAAQVQEGLPLQGPSDYVLALVVAIWGQAAGLALMGLVLLLFGGAGMLALRTALRSAMPLAIRWLSAVGGFGCLVMAAKVVLSVGGVSGVLPLTGLPVALLGYGPTTHLAALLYLALALGTAQMAPSAPMRGVQVVPRAVPGGVVRQRAGWLAVAGMAGLTTLLGVVYFQLADRSPEPGSRHLAQSRMAMAEAVAASMVPADGPSAATPTRWPCTELAAVVAAWDTRLGAMARPVRVAGGGTTTKLRLDPARLLGHPALGGARSCPHVARVLGNMMDADLPRLLGREAALAPTVVKTGSAQGDLPMAQWFSAFEKPRQVGARPLDYTTPNAWWGLPGCLTAPGSAGCEPGRMDATSTDIWLDRQMAPQVHLALRHSAGVAMRNRREVPVGPTIGLTLDPGLQAIAQQLSDCATGRQAGLACQDAWPADAKWRASHYQGANALRAGAVGITVAHVETGRVMAMAGAISECTLHHLGRVAEPDAQGRVPALRDGERCAQLPDMRSAWLVQQHPALWMVPPGSAVKPLAVVAGLDASVPGSQDDAYWKGILAESHERLPIQRVALAAGQRYLDVLHGVGYGGRSDDLLWGSPAAGGNVRTTQWQTERFGGTGGLRSTGMPLDRAEQIRREKLAGVNVDKRYGEAVTREFVAARGLADASVGGGDLRTNALGLLDTWRALDLRARGHSTMPALHLLEQTGRMPAGRALDFMSAQAAARVLGMTSGVSSTAWKGTAQGSCRLVYGACPAQGLPGLSGKTGSSDFLQEEDSPWVKPGLQLPAKLFAGVFTGADGQRYAVAVMALRVREGDSHTLELRPSAPAEVALTLMRQMGVVSGASAPSAPVLTKRPAGGLSPQPTLTSSVTNPERTSP
jgi:cell division protein FtsW (lipid II flippase)